MNHLSVSVAMLKMPTTFNYQAQRVELIRAVSQHTSVKLQTLLFGSDSLPMNLNIEIF